MPSDAGPGIVQLIVAVVMMPEPRISNSRFEMTTSSTGTSRGICRPIKSRDAPRTALPSPNRTYGEIPLPLGCAQPSGSGISPYVLFGLGSAVLGASRDLIGRQIPLEVPVLLVVISNLLFE